MKKKGIAIAAGVVVFCALLAVYFILKNQNKQTEGEEDASLSGTESEEDGTILSVSEEEISSLTFLAGGEPHTWIRSEEGWTLKENEEFPVDPEQMTTLTNSLSAVSAERTLEDIKNLSDYGLEEPQNTVEIEKTDGSSQKLLIGDKNISTGDTYICLNDKEDTVYTVATDYANIFSTDLYHYALSEEYPSITAANIQNVKIDKEENSYEVKTSGTSSTGWEVADEEENWMEADSTLAGDLQTSAAALSFSGYYEYNCQDWSAYGLDHPKMTITIDYIEDTPAEDAQAEDTQTEENSQEEDTQTEENSQAEDIQTEENSQAEDAQTEENSQAEDAQTEENTQTDDVQTEENVQTEDVQTEEDAQAEDTQTEEDAQTEDAQTEDTQGEAVSVQKSVTIFVGALNDDEKYYVRLGDSKEVHGMSQNAINTLMNGRAFDYWKLAVDDISIADLDHLDVTYENQTYTLKRVITEEKTEEDSSDEKKENSVEDTKETSNEDSKEDSNEDSKEDSKEDSNEDLEGNTKETSEDSSKKDSENESDEDTKEETKTVTRYYVNDEETDSAAFMNFFRTAQDMVCQSRLEEYDSEKNTKSPELTLNYYGTDGTELQVTYIPRDASFYTAADNRGNYGLVNKMNVKELINQLIELIG